MEKLKKFENFSNEKNINDDNIIDIIKKLLEKGDINTIARIMTNYNSKISDKKYQEVKNLINESEYNEKIETLIRGMLGIFG